MVTHIVDIKQKWHTFQGVSTIWFFLSINYLFLFVGFIGYFFLGESLWFIWHGKRQKQIVKEHHTWLPHGKGKIKSCHGRLCSFWIQAISWERVGIICNIWWPFRPWCCKLLAKPPVWKYFKTGKKILSPNYFRFIFLHLVVVKFLSSLASMVTISIQAFWKKCILLCCKQDDFWTETENAIRKAYRKTDEEILEKALVLGRGGSTAVTGILINGEKLVLANVGDSRAVMCKNGVAKQLSVDHEPSKEKRMIESRGGFVTNLPGNHLSEVITTD